MRLIVFYFIFSFTFIISAQNGDFNTGPLLQPGGNLAVKEFYWEDLYLCEGEWELTFEDDFNGSNLDLDVWKPIIGVARDEDFSSQKAWHTKENIEIDDGILKIVTKKEQLMDMPVVKGWDPYVVENEDFEYSTGEIWTKKKFGYGKFEARVKLGKGKGLWPAFWLFGHGEDNRYQEIDIYEFWNETDLLNQYVKSKDQKVQNVTIHYDHNNSGEYLSRHEKCKEAESSFSNDFHVFGLIWDESGIYWYVDGKLVMQQNRFVNANSQAYGCFVPARQYVLRNLIHPQDPMYIILNTAVQYGGGNEPATTGVHQTQFPSAHQVDWVRYYERKNCSSNNNIKIKDSSQVELISDHYNSTVAENITFDCSFKVPDNVQYDIIAQESIELNPGFETEKAVFQAKIIDLICTGQYNSINNPKSTLDLNTQTNKYEVLIGPNPSTGHVKVQLIGFSDVELKNGIFLSLFDIKGYKVFTVKLLSYETNLNISHFSNGIYFMQIKSANKVTIEKLILN